MRSKRDALGNLVINGLTPLHVSSIRRVPAWLASDDPRVRDRLFPPAYSDPEEEAHWRRLGAPELHRLFASNRELVTKDLGSIQPHGRALSSLRIEKGHETAWLSALNSARLAIFILHDLSEKDMVRGLRDVQNSSKLEPLIHIHVLAEIQLALIEAGQAP